MIILISKNKLINEFINKLIPELIYKLRNSKSVSDKSVKLFIFKTFEGRKETSTKKPYKRVWLRVLESQVLS